MSVKRRPFDPKRTGLPGFVEYRGQDGFGRHKWLVRVHIGGRQYRARVLHGNGLRELRQSWRTYLEELQIGASPNAHRLSFGDFVTRTWLPHVRCYREDTTLMRYEATARIHVLLAVGHLRLDHVTHGDAQRVIDGMADKGLAAKSCEVGRTVLSGALSYAHKLGHIRRNPARGIEIPRDRPHLARALSPRDVGRFLRILRSDERFRSLYPPVHLMVRAGLRLGEALGMSRSDVDLDAGTGTIQQGLKLRLGGGTRLGDTKTHQARVQSIAPHTVEVLRQHLVEMEMHHRQLGTALEDHGLMFPREDGRPLHPNTFRRRFQQAADAAGLPGLLPKDLRVTAETLLLEQGWPSVLVAKWQGHSEDVAFRHYVPARDELADAAANELDSALAEAEYSPDMHQRAESDAS